MHPNLVFRKETESSNIAFARHTGFGVLAVTLLDGSPLVSHIPFLLSEDGACAEFHLVRSNPIARALKTPLEACIAVQGAHSYISPDWYGIEDQVPTWNYQAVHLVGEVVLRPQEEMRDLLDRQSAAYEEQLRPKAPWRTDKMTPDVLEKMMRQIVPCAMRVEEVLGTLKLGQNKPDSARLRAAEHVAEEGLGSEVAVLVALMRDA